MPWRRALAGLLLLPSMGALAQPAAPGAVVVIPETTITAQRLPRPPREVHVELPIYNEPTTLTLAIRRAASNASWALGSAQNLRDRPAYAAQVVMELEYMSVEVLNHPLWAQVLSDVEDNFRAPREEWRGALGIAPDARSQAVVDGLWQVVQRVQAGAGPASTEGLPPEVFTLSPAETWARLNAMPYLHVSNATAVAVARKLRRR